MRTPETVTQLQSFLGLVNYCRAWIPDCAYHDKGLRCLIQHGMGSRNSLNWTSEAEEHFDALKIAITCAPALGLPDYSRPFHLHAGETVGVAIGCFNPRAWWQTTPCFLFVQTIRPDSSWYACMPSCCGCSGGDG